MTQTVGGRMMKIAGENLEPPFSDNIMSSTTKVGEGRPSR
jgi:hypothetical protein